MFITSFGWSDGERHGTNNLVSIHKRPFLRRAVFSAGFPAAAHPPMNLSVNPCLSRHSPFLIATTDAALRLRQDFAARVLIEKIACFWIGHLNWFITLHGWTLFINLDCVIVTFRFGAKK